MSERGKGIKILITWFSTADGGAEASITDLCNYLAASSSVSKVILLYAHSQRNNRTIRSVKFHKKVGVYRFNVSLLLWNLISTFVVFYLCLKENPDIVQVNFRSVVGESIGAKLSGKKVISSLRVILIDRNNMNSFIFVDHIVGISRAVLERAKLIGWRKRYTLIYNGVDLDRIDLEKFPDRKMDKNKFYSLSRLVRWKRIDWFVKGASNIRKEFPKTKYSIYGGGPKEQVLREMIKMNDSEEFIKLKGWISPWSKDLEKIGTFVLTSYEEPFGKAVIEAVLRGKVVVAPKSGAIPELFPNYDLLFERDNFNDLVNKLRLAYLNHRKYRRQIRSIRKRFIDHYNMSRVRDQYISLYCKMLSKKIV